MDSELINTHQLLVAGTDFESADRKVKLFFEQNVLVKYDVVYVQEENSLSSEKGDFWQKIEMAMEANRKVILSLQNDLKEEGFSDLSTWHQMPQGYSSNIVHTIAHLLDGFFGIDSVFYNLLEDSHWVSEGFMEKMKKDTRTFWLLTVQGSSESPAEANRVSFMRPLGEE